MPRPALSPDELSHATTALREAIPLEPAPDHLLAAAERIAAGQSSRKREGSTRLFFARLSVAAVLLCGTAAGVVWFFWPHAGNLVFAEVAASIEQTHTFTATLEVDGQLEQLYVNGPRIRLESKELVVIADQQTGTTVYLSPVRHSASTEVRVPGVDLYGRIRDFNARDVDTVPAGNQTVSGRQTSVFHMHHRSTVRGIPDEQWTFWVDPQTRLPLQVQAGSALLYDIRFDVPLSDSLFSMQVPPGYTELVSRKTAASRSAWNRFRYCGEVVDETGKAVAGVHVVATARDVGRGFGYIGDADTDAQGEFTIDRDRALSGAFPDGVDGQPIRLDFQHPDLLYARLEDLSVLSPAQRASLHVRMSHGARLSGRVLDTDGTPLAGALVQVVFGKPDDHELLTDYRKATLTDSQGRFSLAGLPAALARVQVRKFGPGPSAWSGEAGMQLSTIGSPPGFEIKVHAVALPGAPAVHHVLGMTLVDLDPVLQRELLLTAWPAGVVILDPGPDAARFQADMPGDITPQTGDVIWMVGRTRVASCAELVQKWAADAASQTSVDHPHDSSTRIVYGFSRPDREGSMTAYWKLTAADVTTLQATAR